MARFIDTLRYVLQELLFREIIILQQLMFMTLRTLSEHEKTVNEKHQIERPAASVINPCINAVF